MNNFYSLDVNLDKYRAIGALSTILQDESLQLTIQANENGNYFFIKDKENGNTYGQTCIDGYHFDNYAEDFKQDTDSDNENYWRNISFGG